MASVRITRQTVANRANVRVGDVVEVSERDANVLGGSGKAVRVASVSIESAPEPMGAALAGEPSAPPPAKRAARKVVR